jgi:hypothetical protein
VKTTKAQFFNLCPNLDVAGTAKTPFDATPFKIQQQMAVNSQKSIAGFNSNRPQIFRTDERVQTEFGKSSRKRKREK